MNTDGGPAYPVPDTYHPNGQVEYGATGMSLRDWFAGQALAWCLSEFAGNAEDMKQPAEAAYQIADAMLRARERGVEVDDDEAWFRAQLNACVYSLSDGSDEATIDYGALSWTAFGANRAAAIRALRAKVEGGGQ